MAQDLFEPDDTPASAKVIVNGVLQSRSLEAGDVDWATFTIGATGASNLRIETGSLTTVASGNTEIWLYDSRDLNKEIAYNDDAATTVPTQFSLITLSSLAPGTYLIKVAPAGINGTVPSYVLRASWTDRADAFEADDTPATAKRITNGEAQERSIHVTGDVDWAGFTIGSNGVTNVRIETTGVSGDTEMWLYGPNSSTLQVAYNDDVGGGSKFSAITLGSLAEGNYLIKVNAFGLGSTVSAYTLKVTWSERGDEFEVDDTPAAAKPISNGQSQSHSIHVAGDVDWATFTIGGNGASNVRIETSGSSGDTELTLYGPNSTTAVFAYNDDVANASTKFSLVTLNSLPPGTYHIKVNEFGNDGTINAYTLRASWSVAPPPTPGDSFESDNVPADAKSIVRGQSQARSLHVPTDVDWVQFTVGANGVFGVRLETSGAAGDTEMWLYDARDLTRELTYADDGGSGRFAAIVLDSLPAGTYYLKISSYRQATSIGSYALRVDWTESTIAPAATRLVNLSIRTNAGAGAQTVIVGFVLSGTGAKPFLLRGVGPTLTSFGVTGVLADPSLQLFRGTTPLASNDNWGGDAAIGAAASAVSAFPLPAASRDAALLQGYAAGSYSVQVAGGTGVVLVEAYEVGSVGLPRLSNISARAQVGTGADVLIAGFVVAGPASKTVLIRAIGPSLTQFGVTGALANPRLDVYRGTTLMEGNDNWGGTPALSTAFGQVGAFALNATSLDAALLLTLQPGSYSAQISGVNATTGTALVELYEVP